MLFAGMGPLAQSADCEHHRRHKTKMRGTEVSDLAMLKGLTKTLSIVAALTAGIGVLGGAAMFSRRPCRLSALQLTRQSAARSFIVSASLCHQKRTSSYNSMMFPSLMHLPRPLETRIEAPHGSPIPFAINFDTDGIEPQHTYALQARIVAGDTLWFVSDERYTIDPKTLKSLLSSRW